MRRPIIGITLSSLEENRRYHLNHTYVTAVDKAGGLPYPLPCRMNHDTIPQLVEMLDGILFTGGPDLHPSSYGETKQHAKMVLIDPYRQSFELKLMAEAEQRGIPMFGICLGCQVMNVHRGGSLIQFLPDHARGDGVEAIEHRPPGANPDDKTPVKLNRHPIKIVEDSILARAIGQTEILGNTSHKQAVDRLGRGLRAVAHAPDGIIEGIEDPTGPLFVGAQWHPEILHAEEDHLALFRLLIRHAQQRRETLEKCESVELTEPVGVKAQVADLPE